MEKQLCIKKNRVKIQKVYISIGNYPDIEIMV